MKSPLAYHLAGTNGGQRPLVLLHGFLGRSQDWQPIIDELPDRETIAVDLPGHGATPIKPFATGPAFGRFACALRKLVHDLGHECCDLVGYSMGGRLALATALLQPNLIGRLALVAASPGIESAAARKERRSWDRDLAEQLRNQPLPAFLAAWYAQPLFASLQARPALLAAIMAQRAAGNPDEMAAAALVLGSGSQPNFWPRLRDLQIPVLAMAGELDGKYAAIAERIAAAARAGDVAIVPGCGHNICAEAPAALLAHLRQAPDLDLDPRLTNAPT